MCILRDDGKINIELITSHQIESNEENEMKINIMMNWLKVSDKSWEYFSANTCNMQSPNQ